MNARPAWEALGLRFDDVPRTSRIALGLAIAALWMLGRRYAGLAHDATLYTAMGLHLLEPGVFSTDLFFAHGSQEAYTLFPRLYAPLIRAFGVGGAACAVTVLGQAGFLAASVWLVSRLAKGPERWWSIALLAAVSGYYGGAGVFRMAEPFASARSLSEPLALVALAAAIAERHLLAWSAVALAAILHPLVAAPTVAALVLERMLRRWRAPAVILGFLTVAAALAALLPWFTQRLDAPWRAAVEARSPQLFIALWPLADWARVAWGCCVAGLALGHLAPGARRLTLAVCATALAGIAASAISVDLLDGALAAGAQAWRAHWLMQFFAIVLLPVAVAGAWRSGAAGRAAGACLAASVCFGREAFPAAAALAAIAVALAASARYRSGWMTPSTSRAAQVLAACAGAVGLLLEVQSRLPPRYGALHPASLRDYVHTAGSVGALVPIAIVLFLFAHSRFRTAGLALALAAVVLSAACWDARTAWERFVESEGGRENPLRGRIAPGAQVFWPAPQSPAWLVLRRPSWISADQGAGIVFSRETALEYARRLRAASALVVADAQCAMEGSDPCRMGLPLPRALCEQRDGPSDLVLLSRIEGHASLDWRLPREVLRGPRALHLYSCADLTAAK